MPDSAHRRLPVMGEQLAPVVAMVRCRAIGVAPSTQYLLLNEGLGATDRVTAPALWHRCVTDQIIWRLTDRAPER